MIKAIRITLFLVGAVLIIDSLVLFALLKFNFGTIVPFFIGMIFIIHAFCWQAIKAFISDKKWLKRGWYASWGLFFVWLVSFILFVFTLVQQINQQTQLNNPKAVIILGAGVNGDKPTPALANRLDKAVPIINNNPNIVAITTGGVGFGREHSEAHVMAKYLQDKHGVPISRISQEGKSTSTEENLLYSQSILANHKVNIKADTVAIVTNDFHTIRAKSIAKKQGYDKVVMIASSTPLSIRGNAWFREYFAFVSGWLLAEY